MANMSVFKATYSTLRHLRQTVHSHYGRGISGFLHFAYVNLLRINTFVIFDLLVCDMPHNDELDQRLRVVRQDIDLLNDIRSQKSLPKEFHCDERLDLDDFFMGIWDGAPAYIHWVFPSGSNSRFLSLGQGCAELNYMLTLPEFRGNRICPQVIAHTARQLAQQGEKRLFCVVNSRNVDSVRAVERAGFREFTRVKAIGPFNARVEVTAQ